MGFMHSDGFLLMVDTFGAFLNNKLWALACRCKRSFKEEIFFSGSFGDSKCICFELCMGKFA